MKKIYLAGSFAYEDKEITKQRQTKLNEVAKYYTRYKFFCWSIITIKKNF